MANLVGTTKEKPLSFMQRLSPEVSVYRPAETTTSTASPKLVVIASWADARELHIAKYVAKYRTLYPAASILLIKNTTALVMRPTNIAKAVAPAAEVVKACVGATSSSSVPSSPEMLVHLFSNGGSSSIATLNDIYGSSVGGGEDALLPLHVKIIDSAPGKPRFVKVVAFFESSLSPMQRILASPLTYGLALILVFGIYTGLLKDWIGFYGAAHNYRERQREVRRTYIYSELDVMIDFRDVEAHAYEAEKEGFEVRLEKFDGSAHVAHVRKDEERYWRIVQSTWDGDLR